VQERGFHGISVRWKFRVDGGFARGSSVRTGSSGRTLAAKRVLERLQSPSAAESPKQDCGENLAAKHSDIAAPGTAGAVAKAGGSEECGDLASEASSEGLVFRSGGDF
jgi:hypothetical protein